MGHEAVIVNLFGISTNVARPSYNDSMEWIIPGVVMCWFFLEIKNIFD